MVHKFKHRGEDVLHLLRSSYLPLNNKDNDWLQSNGYVLDTDPTITSLEHRVYTRDDDKVAVVVHRGTKTYKDYGSDALLALGLEKLSPRFREARRVTDAVKKKYPEHEVFGLGHSLGGSIAEQSGADQVITYNKGAKIPTFSELVAATVGRNKIDRKQTDIRDKKDLFSLFSFADNTKKVQFNNKKQHLLDAHSLDNFERALKKRKLGEYNSEKNEPAYTPEVNDRPLLPGVAHHSTTSNLLPDIVHHPLS